MPFYAIAKGKVPGIYRSWDSAKKQIDGVKGAKYKKFDSEKEAQDFINNNPNIKQTKIELFFKPESDPQENDKTLIVFTDGACSNNGKKNAIAAYATAWPYHPEMNFGNRLNPNEAQTNNRGEYNAVIHALRQADILDPLKKKTLIIYTDSQLLISSLTQWLLNWKKNDWKKSDGEIIANVDLVKILDQQIQDRRVAFRHVRAHTGEDTWQAKHNDIVDRIAQSCTRSL